jgi:hypothetical protein
LSKASDILVRLYEGEISKQQLDKIEQVLDKLFAEIDIDIEFSNHFLDRLNDARNKKQITVDELMKIYADTFSKYGTRIAKMKSGAEAMLKDISTDINIPFVLSLDKKTGTLDMTAKTVMRKKDFKTQTKRFVV